MNAHQLLLECHKAQSALIEKQAGALKALIKLQAECEPLLLVALSEGVYRYYAQQFASLKVQIELLERLTASEPRLPQAVRAADS